MSSVRRFVASSVIVLLLAGAIRGDARGELVSDPCPTSSVPVAYTREVDRALRSGRDVWGDALLKLRDGPTLAAARSYLQPLLFARGPKGSRLTSSGVYYLPFTQPIGPEGSGMFALHVADGSQIIARRASGPGLTIGVGADGGERFGSCVMRLAPARLGLGYLPILETRYVDGDGVRYREESFAGRSPRSPSLRSYVRVVADARGASRGAEIRFTPSSGSAVRVAAPARTSTTAHVSWPIAPSAGELRSVGKSEYNEARKSVVAYWARRLAQGAQIVVPERDVLDAERALLVQDLGLTWRYSVGNPYEEFSYPEGIDVAEVMATYGFGSASKDILVRSLGQEPTRYPNWKMGQKLVASALQYRLFRDRSFVEQATPVLSRYVEELERQSRTTPLGILRRERYSSDIPDSVYGLHSQAVVWQGLETMARVWRQTGNEELAGRSTRLAARLERGLGDAVRRSQRRLADGSLFLDVRLLDPVRPYGSVTDTRYGGYWNLVMPYALASGLFAPGSPEAKGVLRYMLLHGSRLLGMVRAGAFSLYGLDRTYPESGVNQVYGLNVARFLADNHEPDQLVLSLYGQLAGGMTPGTFVAGEAGSVAPIADEAERSMYLPPNGASNTSFLATLQLLLVHETRDRRALPTGLELAYSTPRRWLVPGKSIVVRGVPTSFGRLSYSIRSERSVVRVSVDAPSRVRPARLSLRLRLPVGERIVRVTLGGRPFVRFDPRTDTLDLSGLAGHLELAAFVER
jgi:hypothetical protein